MRNALITGLYMTIAVLFSSFASSRDFRTQQLPAYDGTTTVDIFGTLQDVREVRDPEGLNGVFLTVRGEKGLIDVYVAPIDFLRDLGVVFTKGVPVQVKGSRVRLGGSNIILAREVRWKASITLTLRDARGRPFWKPPE